MRRDCPDIGPDLSEIFAFRRRGHPGIAHLGRERPARLGQHHAVPQRVAAMIEEVGVRLERAREARGIVPPRITAKP